MNRTAHPSIAPLRAAIRATEDQSRALRARTTTLRRGGPATGPARHALQLERWATGVEARHLLLALAFARGRPYRRAERHCRAEPVARRVAAALCGVSWADHAAVWTHPSEALREATRAVGAWLCPTPQPAAVTPAEGPSP